MTPFKFKGVLIVLVDIEMHTTTLKETCYQNTVLQLISGTLTTWLHEAFYFEMSKSVFTFCVFYDSPKLTQWMNSKSYFVGRNPLIHLSLKLRVKANGLNATVSSSFDALV